MNTFIANKFLWIWIILFTLVIDGTYLSLTAQSFSRMVTRIQQTPLKVRYIGVILSYAVIVFLIGHFVIDRPWYDAFLLGAGTYAVFDATNYALFRAYDGWIALQDVLWGGILFTLVQQSVLWTMRHFSFSI